jgi:hypothetical protein
MHQQGLTVHTPATAEPEFSLTSRQAEVAGIEPIGRGFTSRGCSISTAIAAANGTGASQGANVCPAFANKTSFEDFFVHQR